MTTEKIHKRASRNVNLTKDNGAVMKFSKNVMGKRTQRNTRVKRVLKVQKTQSEKPMRGTPRSLKDSRWYPTEDLPHKKHANKRHVRKPTKLRSKIQPGQVLILLTSQHRGKRVVFLKQLPSGLLCVTGPFKLNGCPIKRVSPSMVIGTSTKIELPNIKSIKIDDGYFKNETSRKNTKHLSEEAIAMKKAETRPMRPEQDQIDDLIMNSIQKVPMMKEYLKNRFTLSHGSCPHKMVF